ncbi:transcriptional regulator family: Fungal Specific TF [Penicillium tannophilum]|nr:transcriptional regulator family: Fungal Specific TF [Penicillium tannophilum]
MMKRKVTGAPNTPSKRQPRQDPVSCDSCRKKKLKCDRSHPCSSCTSRRLDCNYGHHGPLGSPSVKPGSLTERVSSIDRVEPRQSQLPAYQPEPQTRTRDDPHVTADRLETIVMGHRVPSAIPATLRAQLSQPHIDSQSRQGSGIITFLHDRCMASHQNPATAPLTSFLPAETEVMSLFNYYCNHLDYQYHLVIPERTKRDIHTLYENVTHNVPIDLNVLALLFSISATAIFFEILSTDSPECAERRSREAAFLAGASLVQSNFMSYPTIAGLQASLIVGHHLSGHLLHPSIASFFVQGTMISQAKSLGLHILDSPSSEEDRRVNGFDEGDVELKRRLWWDLATYDWFLGFLSGPQEFTYSINPKHMNVRVPLNVDDEDIESGIPVPLSTPTCMSYTLARLRLAEICREIVDETASEHFKGEDVPYERILDLERKLHEEYARLPPFFRYDQSSRREFANLYHERPVLCWQRTFVQQGYHARFLRLHRRYFVRGAKDPRYSYSHVVSLQSARKVLELKRIMDEEHPVVAPNGSFFWAIMHHVFMAAVTLLINVCFNWDDILAEKQKQEVLDACRMLSRAQQVSCIAREGINAMMVTLRKHWKQQKRPISGANPEQVVVAQRPLEEDTEEGRMIPFAPPARPSSHPHENTLDPGTTDFNLVPLEDIWSEMLDDSAHVGLDTPAWMDLLNDLTHTGVPY